MSEEEAKPQEEEQLLPSVPPDGSAPAPSGTASAPAAVPPQEQAEAQQSFYVREDEPAVPVPFPPLLDEPQDEQAEFVLPFQPSDAIRPFAAGAGAPGGSLASPPPSPQPRSMRGMLKYLLVAGVGVVALVTGSIFVFAQPTPALPSPQRTTTQSTATVATKAPATAPPTALPTQASLPPTAPPTLQPTPLPTQLPPPGNPPPAGVPTLQQLDQLGWSNAGLSTGDAIEALRTAATFTDREMSLDYRNVGTRAKHGGTLTAATFLLTAGGLERFEKNDSRVSTNVQFDQIQQDQMIQQVVQPASSLVQIQTVQVAGQQHQLVWVKVRFALFQSQRDSATGKRTERLEAASQETLPHQMVVVLLRIPPQAQGSNPPMGGTGWLVNTYALDGGDRLPSIAVQPAL